VAILDIGMPGMDGHDLALRVRALPGGEHLTLIALTGWGQQADRRRSEAVGIAHHLVKPVDPAALVQLLASLREDSAVE
jgi:CheY-like chemotaxis protein